MARNCKALAGYGNLVNVGKNVKFSWGALCFNMWQGIAGKGMANNGLFWQIRSVELWCVLFLGCACFDTWKGVQVVKM